MSLVVILIAVIAGAVWVIWETRVGVRRVDDHWPLVARPLLSPRETELYQRLEAIYPDHRIFVQVALSQLLDVLPDWSKRQSVRNQFSQLVADFVLCRRDLTIVAVIELDDSSHLRADRQDADRRKTKAVESAGLRLIRIAAGHIPSEAELRQIIRADNQEASSGIATSDLAPSILRSVALLRPVLGLAFVCIAVVGGWFVYSHLLAAALPQLAIPARMPVAQTLFPAPMPVSAPPVSSAAVQQEEQRQEQAEHALAGQLAADALAKRKAAAWAAYYRAPASCEHPPAWADQVECGNQYIRAKKDFEKNWQSQVIAENASGESGSRVAVGR